MISVIQNYFFLNNFLREIIRYFQKVWYQRDINKEKTEKKFLSYKMCVFSFRAHVHFYVYEIAWQSSRDILVWSGIRFVAFKDVRERIHPRYMYV